MQGSDDPLTPSTRRILVTGPSGAGKTTLRQIISEVLGLPTVEIDSLYHGAGWIPRPTFGADVDEFTAGPRWVIEWQYAPVRLMLLDRADTLVWLDHGRWTVTRRIVARTLRRRLRRIELWNGNVEPPLRTIFTDPEHIIRWSWNTHRQQGSQALAVALERSGPVVIRVRGQRQVDAWIRGPLRELAAGNQTDSGPRRRGGEVCG